MFKSCLVMGVAVLLAACGVPKPREPATQRVAPGAAAPGVAAQPVAGTGAAAGTTASAKPPQGPGIYLIDPAQSELRLLVYRGGAAARLGHNHVIINRSLGGWIRFTGDPAAAAFSLTVPAADFIVDNQGARSQEGSDFFEEVSEDAKAGTQHNMLSAALLDADRYPVVTLSSVSVTQAPGGMVATLALSIAGHDSTVVAPFQVTTSKGQILASGSIKLRQTSIGLTPYSIMLGALQVQDEMAVKFTLVASAT